MTVDDKIMKFHIPFLPDTIGRPRLHKQLEDCTNYKLTLVSAPPGYGKTTLVAEFARATKTSVLWHSIEARERDVPNLTEHAIQIFKHIYPLLDQQLLMADLNVDNSAVRICEYLSGGIQEDIIYVLDDVHLLIGSRSAEAWLQTFVEHLPPHIHLVIITQIVPTLPLTQMIARREVMAIGADQLRFRIDEIEELASLMESKHPATLKPDDLALHLEGWPAGTMLALQPLPKDVQRSVLKGRDGAEGLFDILAESVFNREQPRMRHFLLATSILTHFSPDICIQALGIEDSHALLIQALNRNLFVSRVAGGMVYHRLFRDYLRNRLKSQHPQRYARLNQQVGEWFSSQGELEKAFEHYILAGEVEDAVAIVEQLCTSYYAQGKLETLLTWRDILGEFISEAPRLAYNCAKIETDRYEYDRVEQDLDIAEDSFHKQGDSVGQVEVILQRCRLHLRHGRTEEVINITDHLFTNYDLNANLQARAFHMLGLALIQQDQHLDAIEHLQHASVYYESVGDQYALASVLQDIEVAYLRCGRLDEASVCLQRVVGLWRLLGRDDTLALAINNLGYHYHQHGNYKQALLTLGEGRVIAERARNKRAQSYIYWSLGDVQRDISDFQEALEHYQRALELNANREPHLHCSVTLSLSSLYRWYGNVPDADYLLEEAEALATEYQFESEKLFTQALSLRLNAVRNPQATLPKLEAVLQQLFERNAFIYYIQVLGLCAGVALHCEDEATCHDYLKLGYDAQQDNQNIQPLIAEIYHDPQLKTFFKHHRQQYGTMAHELDLLERSVIMPEVNLSLTILPTPESSSPFALQVYAFGEGKIEWDGVTVSTQESKAHRSRELFYYLLFMGAKTRQAISLEFWADSSAKKVRSNFHTTLYRIRKALGENSIIYRDNLYMVNPDIRVWCDAREMEACVNQARLLPLTDARADDLWRRAVSMYSGEFLSSIFGGWVTTMREMYYEMYLESLIGAGNCARARGDFHDAIHLYQRCLNSDPFREDAHRALMKCYAAKGEKKLILLHFEKLKDMFQRELGVDPSSQTIELAQKLVL